MKTQLIKSYEQYSSYDINFKEEKYIVENYIEGLYWLIQMYTNTYCIDFNYFYKYTSSPSLLSLYYYLSKQENSTDNSLIYSNITNILKEFNFNIFKNNKEYYEFINYCVAKYIKSKAEEETADKENASMSEEVNEQETNEKGVNGKITVDANEIKEKTVLGKGEQEKNTSV